MSEFINPHPPTITDEATDQEIPNQRHEDWEEGMSAGIKLMFQALKLFVGARRFHTRRKGGDYARANTR